MVSSSPGPAPPARWLAIFLLLSALLVSVPAARADDDPSAPRVVATLPPVHGLVEAVIEGTPARATGLLSNSGSPHSYALKPSDIASLREADIVVWIGPGMERFLVKPLSTILGPDTELVTLVDTPGLDLLPARGLDTLHGHDRGHGGDEGADQRPGPRPNAPRDLHIWLDPLRAQLLVDRIAIALGQADPANAARYTANAARFKSALADLDGAIEARLAPLRHRKLAVFHDAYQYFEARYRLQVVTFLTPHPGRTPGAKSLESIMARISATGARCLVVEPQFRPALAEQVARDLDLRLTTADPLGGPAAGDASAYLRLLRDLADSFTTCLEAAGP